MPQSTFYVQTCPTCCRALEVRVWYLGREVMCRHCGAPFIASLPDVNAGTDLSDSALMRRADELLEIAERQRHVQA
ncbi:MAG: hypothetical protein R3C10_14260 [Pirellulales bacterium]|nr:hypothetical protein [Planctomycetales bacterium]